LSSHHLEYLLALQSLAVIGAFDRRGNRGTRELCGSVMADNDAMLHLARSLGFKLRGTEQNIETVALDLRPDPAA
jgi:L-amino acid N-acyltransferase YncA